MAVRYHHHRKFDGKLLPSPTIIPAMLCGKAAHAVRLGGACSVALAVVRVRRPPHNRGSAVALVKGSFPPLLCLHGDHADAVLLAHPWPMSMGSRAVCDAPVRCRTHMCAVRRPCVQSTSPTHACSTGPMVV